MGNMYPETVTWNPLGGECYHNCEYCYRTDMMRFPHIKEKYTGKPRLCDVPIPKKDGVIFVCSMTDLFARDVPSEFIEKVLSQCTEPDRIYLLQSKNPVRFYRFKPFFPTNVILGTTIETNREGMYKSDAPPITKRYYAMSVLPVTIPKMVSIEPIMDFDVIELVEMIWEISPTYISIGADSKNNGLQEPTREKVDKLITELSKFTEVKIKSNLDRLVTLDELKEK